MEQWLREQNVQINDTWWCFESTTFLNSTTNGTLNLESNEQIRRAVQALRKSESGAEMGLEETQKLLEFMVPCQEEAGENEAISWALDILWSILFSALIIVAIFGNLIVLWIVIGKPRICFGH